LRERGGETGHQGRDRLIRRDGGGQPETANRGRMGSPGPGGKKQPATDDFGADAQVWHLSKTTLPADGPAICRRSYAECAEERILRLLSNGGLASTSADPLKVLRSGTWLAALGWESSFINRCTPSPRVGAHRSGNGDSGGNLVKTQLGRKCELHWPFGDRSGLLLGTSKTTTEYGAKAPRKGEKLPAAGRPACQRSPMKKD